MQLTLLDEFLRCRELPITELLAKFLESRGSVHPGSSSGDVATPLIFAPEHGIVAFTVPT